MVIQKGLRLVNFFKSEILLSKWTINITYFICKFYDCASIFFVNHKSLYRGTCYRRYKVFDGISLTWSWQCGQQNSKSVSSTSAFCRAIQLNPQGNIVWSMLSGCYSLGNCNILYTYIIIIYTASKIVLLQLIYMDRCHCASVVVLVRIRQFCQKGICHISNQWNPI